MDSQLKLIGTILFVMDAALLSFGLFQIMDLNEGHHFKSSSLTRSYSDGNTVIPQAGTPLEMDGIIIPQSNSNRINYSSFEWKNTGRMLTINYSNN